MAGKSIQELRVYFGPDTDMLIPTRLREIIRVEVYGTPDWANYFPNMDIAVVQFKGESPIEMDKTRPCLIIDPLKFCAIRTR